ncbi:unnamed protein product [Trichobilharzia regenti]|nr:unnamed protein product [Trichobilharzia regenti]
MKKVMSVILDDFYVRENCDSGFIKEINSKMRVPDRISLDPNSLSRLNLPSTPTENDNMKVPERIVMSAANSQSSPSIAFNRRGGWLLYNFFLCEVYSKFSLKDSHCNAILEKFI